MILEKLNEGRFKTGIPNRYKTCYNCKKPHASTDTVAIHDYDSDYEEAWCLKCEKKWQEEAMEENLDYIKKLDSLMKSNIERLLDTLE